MNITSFDELNQVFDDLNEFLAGIYQTLRNHEQALYELRLQTEPALTALKEQNSAFAEAFDRYEKTALAATKEAHALRLRLYDEHIARLRRRG